MSGGAIVSSPMNALPGENEAFEVVRDTVPTELC